MTETAATDPIDPVAGFEFADVTLIVDPSEQARALSCCGIDNDVFQGDADPAFFIAYGIEAGEKNGISPNGSVNMIQHLIQYRPAPVDAPITIRGRINTVTEVPRGLVVDTDVWFYNDAGDLLIETPRRSLKPDPAKTSQRGAGERPPPVIEDPMALAAIGGFAFTPDQVKDYNSNLNPIHFEPEAAARAGFHAPIIGGGMGVHFFTAALWRERRPERFDLSIYFRRPIFWDDSGRVRIATSDDGWSAFCLEKDGKVATEARISSLG